MALAHALLSAIVGTRLSGYDLCKQFESSVRFFWQASYQQVYRELNKLEEKGQLEAEVIYQAGRPNKKLHQVTPAGRAELQRWIETPCDVAPLRDDLLVKLFAGHLVPREVILTELARHRELHAAQLAEYLQIEAEYFADRDSLPTEMAFRYAPLDFGIRYEREWLAWCDATIERLGQV